MELYSWGESVEGMYPNGVTREPCEAVSVTINSMASTGSSWRSAGLLVSEVRPNDLWAGNAYRFFLNSGEAGVGAGDDYWLEVRSKGNVIIFPASRPGTLVNRPVTLTIGRDGSDYVFLADGKEVFRDDPVARLGAGVELPYFAVVSAAQSSVTLTTHVDDLDVRVSPGNRSLPFSTLAWSDDFASSDLSSYAEKKLWRDGYGDGGAADAAVTWTAGGNTLHAEKSNLGSPDRGDILWQTEKTFEDFGRLEMRVTGDTNSATWYGKGLILSDSLDYRSSYGTATCLNNAYELMMHDSGNLYIRKMQDGVNNSPGFSNPGIIGTVGGFPLNPDTPYYLDIVRTGQDYWFYLDSDADGPLAPQLVAHDTWDADLKYFGAFFGMQSTRTGTLDVDHIRIYVPEPATCLMLAGGLAGLAVRRRRRLGASTRVG